MRLRHFLAAGAAFLGLAGIAATPHAPGIVPEAPGTTLSRFMPPRGRGRGSKGAGRHPAGCTPAKDRQPCNRRRRIQKSRTRARRAARR